MTQHDTTDPRVQPPLTGSQLAAVAKLCHAVADGAAAAVLVGPAGVGKTRVLDEVVRRASGRPHRVVDDAHLLGPEAIDEFARQVTGGRGPTLILAGQGRLLSLVSRDARLESAVRLRAIVAPMQRHESRSLAASILADGEGSPRASQAALDTLHEIAGGMPRGVATLARLARVLLDDDASTTLESSHVESIHRRLSMTAA